MDLFTETKTDIQSCPHASLPGVSKDVQANSTRVKSKCYLSAVSDSCSGNSLMAPRKLCQVRTRSPFRDLFSQWDRAIAVTVPVRAALGWNTHSHTGRIGSTDPEDVRKRRRRGRDTEREWEGEREREGGGRGEGGGKEKGGGGGQREPQQPARKQEGEGLCKWQHSHSESLVP